LDWLVEHSVSIIFALAGLHLVFFIFLHISDRSTRGELRDFLRNMIKRPIADRRGKGGVHGEIDCFIYDFREILQDQHLAAEKEGLLKSVPTRDQAMPYRMRRTFDIGRNMAETFVEAYPLLGIMGTILAIWAGMSTPQAAGGQAEVEGIVLAFRTAIGTTFWGLILAVVFALIRAALEPGFRATTEQMRAVRELMERAKLELLGRPEGGEQQP